MSQDNTTSLQADNVEDIDDINYLLMIESVITKKWKIGQFKDDNIYLLNNIKDNFWDQPLETVVDYGNKKD